MARTKSWNGICRPSASSAYLLFLKLANKSFNCVVLREFPSAERITNDELRRAISGLQPDNLFNDEDEIADPTLHSQALERLRALPHPSSRLRDLSLLRVVSSFPSEIDLRRCLDTELSMATFTDDEISQPTFLLLLRI
ncbi:hypothetical protein DFH09DRAFT_1341544 [Mycena vulgaris]|nr:hypothetical protein DFH09DRAFT_1341544 [Mycena vulgaris]